MILTPTSTFAEGRDIEGEAEKQIERGGSLRLAAYVSDEDSTAKLPFSVRLILDALVCVAQHGDEQVEQHNHCHHQIGSKDKVRQASFHGKRMFWALAVLFFSYAKESKKE